MFCSLIGLSPCDIILQDINARVIQTALQLLDNRFDSKLLNLIRSELSYVLTVMDGMQFDYEEREDRILNKKLVANMSLFGSDDEKQKAEDHLARANKVFTGNIIVKGQSVAVGSEEVNKILMQLYDGRTRLMSLRNSIQTREFSDDIFFGKRLTEWANSRTLIWLSKYASERLERQDNIATLKRDAEKLFSHVNSKEDSEIIEIEPPSLEEFRTIYIQLSGNLPSSAEEELMVKFIGLLADRNISAMGSQAISALTSIFVYLLLASKSYTPDVAERLEACGLYFMNPVRAESMMISFSDLTLVPERRIVLKNLERGDSYETLLGAIIAACENDTTPIGAEINRGKSQ